MNPSNPKHVVWPITEAVGFDPEYDEKYRDAMLKAKEAYQTIVKDEDSGEWNLL